ncbi:hypothetical protein ACG02S_08345 [Roseateles sp. DC23W]|uniref:HEAT repeat domain-containing protein n=1 Tax=Pelomonas dachongensis TaxID=3299029 RepID=A0ABW7EML5_9BURK
MNRSDLTKLLPRNGADIENARALVALGYPMVEPVLTSLLQWLETDGSPVEMIIRPFFADLGEPALELVRDALTAPIKPARKHALLRYVLPSWPASVVQKLAPELHGFIQHYDFYGLDVWALRLLVDKGIETHGGNEQWKAQKIERLRELLAVLESPPAATS